VHSWSERHHRLTVKLSNDATTGMWNGARILDVRTVIAQIRDQDWAWRPANVSHGFQERRPLVPCNVTLRSSTEFAAMMTASSGVQNLKGNQKD